MELQAIRTFFMWCTLLNGALLVLTFGMLVLARERVCAIHAAMFGTSKETVITACYGFMILYKVLWIVFAVVPFIALWIMG